MLLLSLSIFFFFFFNDTATTEIYTLSLHDALPIYDEPQWPRSRHLPVHRPGALPRVEFGRAGALRSSAGDRKSTRLNSSHQIISYAVFCLKKKKKYYTVDIASRMTRRLRSHTCDAL